MYEKFDISCRFGSVVELSSPKAVLKTTSGDEKFDQRSSTRDVELFVTQSRLTDGVLPTASYRRPCWFTHSCHACCVCDVVSTTAWRKKNEAANHEAQLGQPTFGSLPNAACARRTRPATTRRNSEAVFWLSSHRGHVCAHEQQGGGALDGVR